MGNKRDERVKKGQGSGKAQAHHRRNLPVFALSGHTLDLACRLFHCGLKLYSVKVVVSTVFFSTSSFLAHSLPPSLRMRREVICPFLHTSIETVKVHESSAAYRFGYNALYTILVACCGTRDENSSLRKK